MLPHQEGPFEVVEVLRDPYVLLTRADSPVDVLEELDGAPLIGYRRCRSSSLLENALRTGGIEPNVVFRSDDNGTVQGFVATGLGTAVVPQLALQPEVAQV